MYGARSHDPSAPSQWQRTLKQACQRIEDRVLNAEGDDFTLLLDALQVGVHAEKGRGA